MVPRPRALQGAVAVREDVPREATLVQRYLSRRPRRRPARMTTWIFI
jgi:hypothetical protein